MAATPKSCVLDVENMTIAQLEEAIGGIKLAQGKSLARARRPRSARARRPRSARGPARDPPNLRARRAS